MCILLTVQFCRTLATLHLLDPMQSSVPSFMEGIKALKSLNSECCEYLVILELITVHAYG